MGGRKGDQIVADLNGEGILCDFVRVAGESRISTAVVDSATNAITEINEQGPEIQPEELEALFDKLDYLGRAVEIVVLGGQRAPGAGRRLLRPDDPEAAAAGRQGLLLHLRRPAPAGHQGPARTIIFPKLIEAEKVIGYEFTSMEDRILAARRMREMGAGSVIITFRFGCIAELEIDGCVSHVHRQDARRGDCSRRWDGATLSWAGTRSSSWTGRRRSSVCGSGWAAPPRTSSATGRACSCPRTRRHLAKRVEFEEVSAE